MPPLHPAMPSIGTHVQVLRDGSAAGTAYHAAIVVGHFNDVVLGDVLELLLRNSTRLQRTWPNSTVRLA
jgi:hypothetical protein